VDSQIEGSSLRGNFKRKGLKGVRRTLLFLEKGEKRVVSFWDQWGMKPRNKRNLGNNFLRY